VTAAPVTINTVVNNPLPEKTSVSVMRKMRTISALGLLGGPVVQGVAA
jgi:hypothetical protein